MPTEPAEVTCDDVLAALRLIGCPTVLARPDLDAPDAGDLPQLIGALAAAVDRLALAHTVVGDLPRMRAWTAGYLQTAGAAGGACGSRTAFETLTVRLQMFQILFEGYRTHGPLAGLLRTLIDAACCYAVSSATASAVRAGVLPDNDDSRGLSRRQLAEGHSLLTTAANLERDLREQLAAAERAGR